MLTADQIEALRIRAGQITDPVIEFLITDIAQRIAEAGQLTSTASYQIWRAQHLGLSQRQLKKELRKRLKVSHRELRKLLTQAAELGYDFDIKRFPFVQAVPFIRNESLQKIVNTAIEQAGEELTNLTQTMGFVTYDGVATELTEAYQKSCDFAFEKVITGAQDYNSAIRDATRGLAEKGILTLDYESGVHRSLEAAVRGNIMGGLGLMQERISQHNHDELGCDGWEISAHMASAPDHEPIQGKQYSDAAFMRLNNSLLRRIGTLNCGHSAMPIILGVNSPQYTDDELDEMRQENEKGIDYNGKHYTQYEATQRQRALERSVRKQKRRILIDESQNDKERLLIDQTKYVVIGDEYKRFTKAAGLRIQRERMNVHGFGPRQAVTAEKDTNKAHFDWLKSIGAENTSLNTLDKFYEAKYNNSPEYQLLNQYSNDVKTGWISPLSGFDNYQTLHSRIQNEIVGRTAANGIEIKGQVPHFMQRVIGTMVDPEKLKRELKVIRRSGVEFDDIKAAIFSPEEIGSVLVRKSGKRSVKLIGKKCAVSINPDTGELIQTNPL